MAIPPWYSIISMLCQKAIIPEFEWTPAAQSAMDILKEKARTAPPLITIDYTLASQILRPQFCESDVGLVTLAVDSFVIGAGWIISQIIENGVGGKIPHYVYKKYIVILRRT
jgi:hypothetical protein